MRADLHIHSTYSDGLCSPDELCRLALKHGIQLLSITDHDTMNGEEIKRAAAEKYGLKYLSGWEISAYDKDEKIHILGYGCRQNEAYTQFMETRKQMAYLRAEDRLEKMRKIGVPVTMDHVVSFRADPTAPIHTMHVARAIAMFVNATPSEVYLQYLNNGKIAYSDIGRPTPEEAIDCIHAAGGFAVIAHPGRMRFSTEEKENSIRSLAEYGADGIEAVYTTHTKEETAWYKALAEKYHLLITGGSDTHIEDDTHTIGNPVFHADEKLLEKIASVCL
jgi:predicted metal-dependent phosphoesterase TrpH